MTNLYVGIMSGTSLDGIDIALTRFNAGRQAELVDALCLPFPVQLREELLSLCQPGDDELRRAGLAGQAWARLAADGVLRLLRRNQLAADQIEAIGSHGQTLRHHPELGFSWQVGAPALLAELSGIRVISDFRSRDLAAGGEGAPLVPAFHDWLLRDNEACRTLVNIGGFANLTVMRPGEPAVGFDSGPGNVLLDDWINLHLGKSFDSNGDWARRGQIQAELLRSMLDDPYFHRQGPKSTGREYFHRTWLNARLKQLDLAPEPQDVQATLLELTAQSIAHAVRTHAADSEGVFICGGGANNTRLLERLQNLLAPIIVSTTTSLGVHPDWMEAIAFAWLAWRCQQGLPGNLPDVTGAKGPRVLGAIYPA